MLAIRWFWLRNYQFRHAIIEWALSPEQLANSLVSHIPMESSVTKRLRIAVMSDLHAFSESTAGSQPSFYPVSNYPVNPLSHPVSALKQFIHEESISADLLLCPGDIGDKCASQAITQAWSDLHAIGKLLGAKLTLATCGNHDIDSRYLNSNHDARGLLMALKPAFPLDDEALYLNYWAKNYAVIVQPDYRAVLLNSCAFHGAGKESSKELDHGRISINTLEWLRTSLKATEPRDVNILLCHHHPKVHPEIDYEDYEVMRGGASLLQLLGTGEFGKWLVIHGHKHHPKIDYASGGGSVPVVFSAGSFSAHLYPELTGRHITNQFYILEVHVEHMASMGLVGQLYAWDWNVGNGWRAALGTNTGLGIPRRSGFGANPDVTIVARTIATHFKGRVTGWSEVMQAIPELPYMLPSVIAVLNTLLERDHELRIVFENGVPIQLGVKQ